jgi:carbamoyl-phosphate synthase large subunit
MKKNILVTGAGSLLGQGILRLLQIADFDKTIYTADPDTRSSGHWLGNVALTIPKVSDSGYINSIIKLIENYKLDAILIGTDVELPILSEYQDKFLKNYSCKIIVSSENIIRVANDKYLTAKFLEENQFPFPYSVLASNYEGLRTIEEKLGFPLFAKPVYGARSIGIKKINSHEELFELYHKDSNLVVQQYLSEDEGEYTSGCIVVNGECKVIVTLKRDLRDGNTYRAYRDKNTSMYDDTIKRIAEKLNPYGPVNFQFRIENGKPIIFEINGRFSGTTPLRHFFGYNEVESLLKFHLFDTPIETPTLRNGVVLRAWSDLFIEEQQFDEFDLNTMLVNPKSEMFNFSLK